MFRPADEGRASFKFTLPENFLMQERIAKEVQHGRFLAQRGAGEIWNWESPAGKLRWARRGKRPSTHFEAWVTVLEFGCRTRAFSCPVARSGAGLAPTYVSPAHLGNAQTNCS